MPTSSPHRFLLRTPRMLLAVALLALLVACAPPPAPVEDVEAVEPVPVEEADGVDVRVGIEESFLNTILGQQLTPEALAGVTGGLGVDLNIQDPQVDVAPPNWVRVTATIDADAYGLVVALRPTVSLRIMAEGGDLAVELGGVSLGDVQAPLDAVEGQLDELEQTIQAQLAGALQTVQDQAGLQIANVLATDDTLYLDMGR